MNRRAFITSLLATTAAIPIARLARQAGSSTALVPVDWQYAMRVANVEYTMIYYTEETPMRFTGFRSFVPAPDWLDKTYDLVEAE
jgi:hypothetical protein